MEFVSDALAWDFTWNVLFLTLFVLSELVVIEVGWVAIKLLFKKN